MGEPDERGCQQCGTPMYAYGGEALCRACRYPVLAEDERVCLECRCVFDWAVWGHELCPSCYDLYVGDVEYDPTD